MPFKQRTPEQWEQWFRKQKIWKHNSFLGHCAMINMQMSIIQQTDTVTEEAKVLASEIQGKAQELSILLKERANG